MKLLSAEWCSPCKTVKKFIKDNNYDVMIMDVDEHPNVAKSAGIKSVPSLLLATGELISGSDNIIGYIEANGDKNTNT